MNLNMCPLLPGFIHVPPVMANVKMDMNFVPNNNNSNNNVPLQQQKTTCVYLSDVELSNKSFQTNPSSCPSSPSLVLTGMLEYQKEDDDKHSRLTICQYSKLR